MSDKKTNPGTGKRNNKPGLSSASQTSAGQGGSNQGSKTVQAASTAASSRTTDSSTTTTHSRGSGGGGGSSHVVNEKPSKSWLAPLALLFGLVGTGWSAYLWSQLKSLGENTTTQLQSQAEATKTSVATVKTELDEKTSAISQALEEQKAELTSSVEEKTASLTTALEEKTGSLSAAIEEKTGSLSAAIEEKTASLSSALEEKTTSLSAALADTSGKMDQALVETSESLKQEVISNKEDVATNTASAMQEFTSKTELEINNVSTSFNTGLALLRERSDEKITTLEEKMGQLDESVRTTNELASRGQRDWMLAEVNYLLRTGVHRVKLAGDLKAGVIALESASDRLHALGDINYMPVREQIAEEVAALRRIGPPDIEGLIFKLQHMSKRADSLPLPVTQEEQLKADMKENPVETSKGLGSSLFSKLKGSVSIGPSGSESEDAPAAVKQAKTEEPSKEQLDASDALRLHLQAARLSALRHDSENFMSHMDNSINYSKEIFDQDSNQVKTYISDLTEIRETPIVPKTPALGSSLSLFSKIDAKRGEN